jgi:hypothetical protein
MERDVVMNHDSLGVDGFKLLDRCCSLCSAASFFQLCGTRNRMGMTALDDNTVEYHDCNTCAAIAPNRENTHSIPIHIRL